MKKRQTKDETIKDLLKLIECKNALIAYYDKKYETIAKDQASKKTD
jgi:hypothetical protein